MCDEDLATLASMGFTTSQVSNALLLSMMRSTCRLTSLLARQDSGLFSENVASSVCGLESSLASRDVIFADGALFPDSAIMNSKAIEAQALQFPGFEMPGSLLLYLGLQ